MKRNKNVDILRAGAILIIVVYHAYVLAGGPWSAHARLHTLLSFGGEFGVTLFFLLSGFGICSSLMNRDSKNQLPNWWSFMKQRALRILPQYYCCLGIMFLFQAYAKIGRDGIWDLISYLTFTQNFSVQTHGSVNGALWAMATIFQFYLVAIPLYRLVRKNWAVAAVLAVAVSVGSKFLLYHLLFAPTQADASMYFVYGRQVLTALDNFVLGMVAAKVLAILQKKTHTGTGVVFAAVLSLGALVGATAWSYQLASLGVYADNLRGYAGHSVLAILLALLILGVGLLPQAEGKLLAPLQFVAKYQYGMYLWHMPVLGNLIQGAPFFQGLAVSHFIILSLFMIVITAIMGFFSAKWVDSIDYRALFCRKIKTN